MSDDLFQRAGEIFEAALAVPAGQRAALARSRCGDDGELLREVLSLLSFHHAETTVLSEDALRVELPTVAPDAPLCFLSRVESIKGAHWAIEIARRTARRLVIAGNHADSGAEGEYWRTRIEPWIGRDGIEYVGAVDDVAKNRVLGEAAAMVVPIQWDEPFGIVFAEALACGTPVISCPRGSLPEIVRQGVDGFLVGSIEEGCEAVARLGDIDRAGCRRRAEQEYAPDVVVARYVELYERARADLAARR